MKISCVSVWESAAKEVAERIMGLGDHGRESETKGCYDRMYWKYKLIDYPSVWFQSASEYLALLWQEQNGRFYHNPVVAEWCQDACSFTFKKLNKDGSCSEAYPFERSFCGTAFTLAHLCKAVSTMPGKTISAQKLNGMGLFLENKFGDEISNQLAAASLAQFRLGKLANDKRFSEDGRRKIEVLYKHQHADGYFDEYGGFDIGYLSITLSFLARIEQEFPGTVEIDRARKAMSLLQRFIHANGTYDYEKSSRKTQFLYPFGLAFWKSPASSMLEKGLKEGAAIRPAWLDDRYVIEMAVDYMYTVSFMEKGR